MLHVEFATAISVGIDATTQLRSRRPHGSGSRGHGILPDTDRVYPQLRKGGHEASDLDRLGHVHLESHLS